MAVVLIFLALASIFVFSYALPLLSNYRRASKSGFPIYITPINPHNTIWMVINGFLLDSFSRHLPDFLWLRIRYTMHGWQFADHKNNGGPQAPADAFILVSSGSNQLWIEDTEIGNQITARIAGFEPSFVTKKLIGIFGPSVMTVQGQDWHRHRKIVTSAMGERICKLAWNESQIQAERMVEKVLRNDGKSTDRTVEDLKLIAMNVLASCGYGASWDTKDNVIATGHSLPWVEVLKKLTTGFIAIAVVGGGLLRSTWMPRAVQEIGLAAADFPKYATEFLEQERSSISSSKETSRTFLSQLVRACEDQVDGNTAKRSLSLSMSEFQGNLFQFTLAGFDTTANTLAYAVARLATEPSVQRWIAEEVDQVFASDTNLAYEETFPKLKRCLALMLEILRLYTPVSGPWRTVSGDQSISRNANKTLVVPHNTLVLVDFSRIHTRSKYWRDPFSFCPSRWIVKDSTTLQETLIDLPRGIYGPWSAGQRICPGMKMAQVEFVVVISSLIRQFTVGPTLKQGETVEQARQRTLKVIEDSQPMLTLQMNRPKDLELVWTKRSSLD